MRSLKIPGLCMFLFMAAGSVAQNTLTLPHSSQKASVSQTVGLTEMNVTYHSPLVQGRKIWGGLVPYKELWRTGANENTIITFSTDVTVEGGALAAGTYGLHTIPGESEWTIIFSKNSTSWGSYFYKKEEDALRVTVKPVKTDFQEWLSFGFADRKSGSTVLELRWESLKVPVKIGVDVSKTVLENMRRELRGTPAFTWEGWYQAASFSYFNSGNLEEAGSWIDKSIQRKGNINNLWVKSLILAKQGKAKESEDLRAKAITAADKDQVISFSYDLMDEKHNEEAIEVLNASLKKSPDWEVYTGLGNAYENKGNKQQAIENYRLALAKAPKEQQTELQSAINKLEK